MSIPYESKPLPAVSTFPFDIGAWGGVNKTKGNQAEGEMADCKNMASDNYPYASPRKPRGLVIADNVKRIYKVEGDSVYYIDGEDYLCYVADGVKSYVVNADNEKIQMADCICTNNYDGGSVFYPDVRYIGDDNEVLYPKWPLDLGDITGPYEYENFYGEKRYKVKLETTLFIDNTDATTFKVSVKFPPRDELSFPTTNNYDDYIQLTFALYDKNGQAKSDNEIVEWNYDDDRSKSWVIGFEKFEKGDYIVVRDEYVAERADDAKLAQGEQRLKFIKAGEWVVEPFVENGHTLGNPLIKSLDYGVVYNNRIVGVSDSDIRASALGDFNNFSEFVDEAGNPSATGAYATDVGSAGQFTGICAYNNVLLLFKRDIVYEMYGSMPYTLTELCNTGCIDNDSIASVDGVLYWASPKGIVRYSGGVPQVISTQIDIKTETIAKAGTDGRKYYIYNGEKTYVYDTYLRMWHIEDDKNIKMFYNLENTLYCVADEGIYKLGSGNEAVEWEFETKDFTFGSENRKNLSKLWIRAEMPKMSRLEVYAKQNGGQWQRVAVKTAERDEMFDFKLRIKKCDSFSLKFKGKGDVRILDVHGKVTVGTSKHRSGASLNVYRK